MSKLIEVFKTLAAQSGISTEDIAAIISANGNKPFDSIELDDANSNLMTEEKFTFNSAINNPKILAKAKAQVLNGVDSELKSLYDEYELSDEARGEIEKSESSFKKIGSLTKKIQALTSEKNKATGKDKDVLSNEISKLNGDLKSTKETYEKKISEIESARKQDRVDWALDSIYGSKEYSLPVDKDIAKLTAKNAVQKYMNDKGVVIKPSENGDLILETTAGSEYFENNVKMSPQDFITKRLTEAKLLKVSQGTSTQATTRPLATGVESTVPKTKKVVGLESLDKMIEATGAERGF